MQTDNTYDSYLEWKKWGKIQSDKTWQKQYFEKELDQADFASLDRDDRTRWGNPLNESQWIHHADRALQ